MRQEEKGATRSGRRKGGKYLIHIQSAISPFPVGIQMVASSPGTPDKKSFQFRVIEDPGRGPVHSPFQDQGTCACCDGCRRRGTGNGSIAVSGCRSRNINARCRDIRLDLSGPGVSPAGIQIEAVIIGVISSGGDHRSRVAGRGDVVSGLGARKVTSGSEKPVTGSQI